MKSKLILLLLVGIFLMSLTSAVIIENQTWFVDNSETQTGGGGSLVQTFRLNYTNFTIDSVELKLSKTGTPGLGTITIVSLNGTGFPTFTNVTDIISFDADLLPLTPSLQKFNFTTSPIFNSGITYGIFLNGTAVDADNINFRRNDTATGSSYPNGSAFSYVSGSLDWTNTTRDFLFNIYGSNSITLTQVAPLNGSSNYTSSVIFNGTAVSITNLVNSTLSLYYQNQTLFNTSRSMISGLSNTTTFNITNFVPGTYFWNIQACRDNNECVSTNNNTFTWGSILNSQSLNVSTYETASESYFANITLANGVTLSSANLYYNNTAYSGTITTSGPNKLLTRSLDIPFTNVSISNALFWELVYSTGQRVNLTSTTQSVSNLNLSICGASPQNVPYINFTFKNETIAQESITAQISSTWSYYLGDGTLSKSYSYASSGENPSYAFCLNPTNRTVYASPTITYSNAVSVQRSYSPGLLTLTNSTTNTTLYLLPTSAGLYVSFQVKTIAGSTISGATINISRSGYGLIESRTTDDSGVATFFLDPLISYSITTSKTGYDTLTQTITPSQTTYTITLGGSSSGANTTLEDFSRGISYIIGPQQLELTNNTNYTFSFDIDSTYWGLTSYGFNLTLANGTVLTSASDTSSAGSLVSISYNTGNHSFIRMNYYWYIGGNLSTGTRTWIVVDNSDTGFSISRLFTDLRNFLTDTSDSDGLFGLTLNTSTGNFSLAILIFLAIFSFAGIMSYKYGLTSSAAIGFLIFSGILFFDVGLGLMPNILGIPNFLTMFIGLVVIALFLKEAIY